MQSLTSPGDGPPFATQSPSSDKHSRNSMTLLQNQNVLARPGLYVVKTALPNKLGEHYGILDVGNRLRRSGVVGPVVYQLAPRGVIATEETTNLTIVAPVIDEMLAAVRFEEALKKSQYDLLTNNCEHFARFVAFGTSVSGQAQLLGLAGVAAVFGLIVFLGGANRMPAK